MSDYERPSTGRVVGWGTIILVGFLALLVVGSLAGLGWRYVIAGPKGAVGAKEIQQDAQNRVQQQAKFEQIRADYDGYLIQIANAKAALKSAPATTRDQRETELIGLRQICVTAAQDFNAESRKYVASVWKSAGLPETLDPKACQGS